jgi:hypothetical protein
MKKLVYATLAASVLTACGTTEKFEKRAEEQHKREVKYVEQAVDKAPNWMNRLPESKEAVYANGTAVSRDYGMASNKAKTIAYGKICMAAGGKVDQQTKIYMMDSESGGSEMSETAIRSMCPGVDITGVETVEVKTVAEGTKFRSYVLVALPTGEANPLQERKDKIAQQKRIVKQSDRAYNEMDARKAETE